MLGYRLRVMASSAPAVRAPEIRRARAMAVRRAVQARLVPAPGAAPRGEGFPAGSLAAAPSVVPA